MQNEITPSVLSNLPAHVDISCVQAFHNESDVRALATTARRGRFVAAHVLPNWIPLLRSLLAGSSTVVGSPAGFPSGGSMTAVKLAEASAILDAGAQELDFVINVGRVRSGDYNYVTSELRSLVELVNGTVPLRVILEVGFLSDDEIRASCDCALEAGVPWIKTGTGWSGRPTELHHIELISERVAGRAAIKAAGGVRDLSTVRAMAELGVTRFGLNADTARRLTAEAASLKEVEK